MSYELDAVYKSMEKLEPVVGKELYGLPIFIDETPNGPPAYTNAHGIWVARRVVENDAHNFHVYLMHEIMHHVVNDHSKTGKFSPTVVNYAEDYRINYLQHTLWGFDVRKVKYKGIYSSKLGKHEPKFIAEQIVAKHKRMTGVDLPELKCGCMGIAHPTIQKVANRVRTKIGILPADPLIYFDLADVENYNREIERIRHSTMLNSVYVDMSTLVRALWFRAYMEKPRITGTDKYLSTEKAITYLWNMKGDYSGDDEKATIAVISYVRCLNKYDRYTRVMYALARGKHGDLKLKISQIEELFKVGGKSLKGNKRLFKQRLKKYKERLLTLEKKLPKLKVRAEVPLSKLFEMYPPEVIIKNSFSTSTNSLSAKKRETRSTTALVRVKNSPLVVALRTISRLTEERIDSVLSVMENMRSNLDDMVGQEDDAEIGDEGDKEGGEDEGTEEDFPGEGESEDQSDDYDQEEDINPEDNRSKPGQGGGAPSKKKKTAKKETLIDNVTDMDDNVLKHLSEILRYKSIFDTSLSTKSSNKINPDSTKFASIPSYSDDIENIHSSEVAILAREETQLLFLAKLADHSLLTNFPQENKRSAVAIAIDGSGSMNGTLYEQACGFALSMMGKLLNDNRGCILMLFSDDVHQEIILTPSQKPNMMDVLRLMASAPFSGTNVNAPLLRAYEVKAEQKWQNMSTVIITDAYCQMSNEVKYMMEKALDHGDKFNVAITGNKAGAGGFFGLPEVHRVRKDAGSTTLTKLGNSIL